MYAIFTDGKRQFKAEEGQELELDYRDLKAGETLKFERVLAVSDGGSLKLGSPLLKGATVTAEVVGLVQGPKLTVQKKRRRKNMDRRTGHRQMSTKVKISKISL
jgi:large subunit ribosomal protein L21